ncbi:bacteriocin [Legionella yabuuchiae]|uniref:bacteriocin n=1 Tax=Legionella yabuuchiae TaxID=376727 RepID=UPI0013EFBA77|nr:bacteriocin [Legionella yabuuchiae]
MEKKTRVLGYYTSKELSNEDLMKISGGSVNLTCQHTQRGTGSFPGNLDAEADQIWD